MATNVYRVIPATVGHSHTPVRGHTQMLERKPGLPMCRRCTSHRSRTYRNVPTTTPTVSPGHIHHCYVSMTGHGAVRPHRGFTEKPTGPRLQAGPTWGVTTSLRAPGADFTPAAWYVGNCRVMVGASVWPARPAPIADGRTHGGGDSQPGARAAVCTYRY